MAGELEAGETRKALVAGPRKVRQVLLGPLTGESHVRRSCLARAEAHDAVLGCADAYIKGAHQVVPADLGIMVPLLLRGGPSLHLKRALQEVRRSLWIDHLDPLRGR